MAEEVLLVAAELEEGQRVGAVAADQLGGSVTRRGSGQRPRCGQRAEDHVGHRQQRPELDQMNAERDPGQVVVESDVVAEMDRPAAPQQQVAGLTHDRRERRMALRGPGGERRHSDCEHTQQRHAPDRRAQRDRVVTDWEGGAGRPQDRGGPPGDRCLLEVESLEQVEQTEAGNSTIAACQARRRRLRQVRRDQQQREPGRQRERVEQAHRLDRLEVEQQMAAPADVRRQRRGDVDHADDRRGKCGETGQPA